MSLPVIASFWAGSPLSLIEVTVIQSYLDRGHHFVLYSEGDLPFVPAGVEQRPAAEIWHDPKIDLPHATRHQLAVYSDIFRLHLLAQTEMIWVDMDAYCLKPFDFKHPFLFAHGGNGRVCSGVLRLPPESKTLQMMLEFVQGANPIQPWRKPLFRRRRRAAIEAGETWTIYDLAWGCSGPKALSWFLKQTGEIRHALPQEAFYPLFGPTLRKLWLPDEPLDQIEPAGAYSVHIFGATREALLAKHNGKPPRGSYLERIAQRHGMLRG